MMKVDYLCKSWQYMLQQIVYLTSKGYVYYFMGEIPLNKSDKAVKIDNKIISKYNIDLSKHQRARRKNKGLANFYYLRWKNQFVILHTEGKFERELDDAFYNIKKVGGKSNERFSICAGKNLILNIVYVQDKITVKIDKDVYRDMKSEIDSLVKNKSTYKLKKYFEKLNGIPAWGGICKQKKMLHAEVFKCAKRYNLNTKTKHMFKYPYEYEDLKKYPLWINTYRKPVAKEYQNENIEEWL